MQSLYITAIYRKSQGTSCCKLSLTFGFFKILAKVVGDLCSIIFETQCFRCTFMSCDRLSVLTFCL
jgi:hypothetical protein